MSDEIEWETPPTYARVIGSGQRPGRYARFAEQLREHIDKWALLPQFGDEPRTAGSAVGLAGNIRNGRVKGFEKGTFETAIADGTIWVRCLDAGDDEDDAPGEVPPRMSSGPDPTKVRTWAKRQGIAVSNHGRLPKTLVDSYLEEHPEEQVTVRVVR